MKLYQMTKLAFDVFVLSRYLYIKLI